MAPKSGPRGHTGAVRPSASNWTGLRRGGPVRPILIVAALTLIPLTIAMLKLFADRPLPEWSIQHFYIVSAASLLAAAVAAILAVTTAQIGLYRVLLICLGFTSMGGIFAVHGLLTPGVIVPDRLEASAYRVIGMTKYFRPRALCARLPGRQKEQAHVRTRKS